MFQSLYQTEREREREIVWLLDRAGDDEIRDPERRQNDDRVGGGGGNRRMIILFLLVPLVGGSSLLSLPSAPILLT